MHEGTWMGSWNSPSDNRKSKTCTESRRSIQNRKLVGIVAIVTTIAICGAVAYAQQSARIPQVGLIVANRETTSARELRQVFQRIGMTREVFESRAFTRVKCLSHLSKTGQLDSRFFWTEQ